MGARVVLVDDVAELRITVRQALRLQGGFDVVGEAADGAEAIAAARQQQPDIVVLDLGLPDLAGHEVLTGIQAAAPRAQVVVYTGSITDDRFELVSQVAGFVRKDQDIRYLVDLLTDLAAEHADRAVGAFGPDLADVSLARRFVADHCRRWQCTELIDDAELVVTELVTNAFVHARSRCEVRLRLRETTLRLEVADDGGGTPDLRAAGDHAESGRGLLLISAVAAAWGVDAQPGGGKVVWAELFLRPGASGGDRPGSMRAERPTGPPPRRDQRGPSRTDGPASDPDHATDAGSLPVVARAERRGRRGLRSGVGAGRKGRRDDR